jgi:hypothetical protein
MLFAKRACKPKSVISPKTTQKTDKSESKCHFVNYRCPVRVYAWVYMLKKRQY